MAAVRFKCLINVHGIKVAENLKGYREACVTIVATTQTQHCTHASLANIYVMC